MVTSTWASNLVWVLLGANWVLEGRWREKWQMARESRLLQAFVVFYLLMLVGMLWTEHVGNGFAMLQVRLPLLVVPLVVLTSRPIVGRARRVVLALYAGTVLVVSAISLVRLYTIPDLPYRDAVPYISHIRFALNCCMVIYLLCGEATRQWSRRWPLALVCLLPTAYLLFFLLKIHSYTAVAVLAAVSIAVLLVYYRRWPLLAAWLLVAGTLTVLVVHEVKAYYRMVPQATEPLVAYTAGGRPYVHRQDGIVESGNYINNYVCPEELRAEWERRSAVPYDSVDADGWTVQPTLVRYLNALGLTKDSAGVASLTDEQVAEVVDGVANPVYAHGSLPKHMLYVLFFELENYRCYRAVTGFSMLQRLELWQAALHVVADHPWLGVGTGDLADAMEADFRRTSSPLQGSGLQPHSLFLALAAQFGLPLFVLLVLVWLRAVPRLRRQGSLIAAWAVMVLVSCVTENTLGTLTGILFATWFMAFRQPDPNRQPTGDKLC